MFSLILTYSSTHGEYVENGTYLEFLAFGSLVRGVEVVVLQRVVADDVVVDEGVALWPEVPWLLLRIVRPVLQPLQLVLKVEHIVRLLVPEGLVLVLGEHVDERVVLLLLRLLLDLPVLVDLRDRVVLRFLFLHVFVLDLDVRVCLALELLLLVDVGADVGFPVVVLFLPREEHFVACRLSYLLVCARDGHFLIWGWWKLYKFLNYN